MTDLILHHYPTSPYAEKIRAILGYKKLPWKSVHIPTVMPKPDLLPLTGGYRKTPVLQIGADIYCDTKLIARVIEQRQPEPTLIPASLSASIAMQEAWSEELFLLMVPIVMQPAGLALFFSQLPPDAPAIFQKDRQALFAGGGGTRPSMKRTQSELPAALARLDIQLANSKFLHGEQPTLADFSLFHPVWFVRNNPGIANSFDAYRHLLAWYGRIAAYGHGQPGKMTGTEALEIARSSTPQASDDGDLPDPGGLKTGDAVVVSATDYGADPVKGVLVRSSLDAVSICREGDRVGEVVVHFPRAGFRMTADKG